MHTAHKIDLRLDTPFIKPEDKVGKMKWAKVLPFFVCDLYALYAKNINDLKKIKQILIHLEESKTDFIDVLNSNSLTPPIITLRCGFDLEFFNSLNTEFERCACLLTYLDSNIAFLCNALGWDYAPFEAVKVKIIHEHFKAVWHVGTPCYSYSKNRRYKTSLICEPHYSYYDYFLLLEEKRDKTYQLKIKYSVFKSGPDTMFWPWLFAKMYWEDDDIFILKTRFEEMKFVFNIKENKYAIELIQNKELAENILMLLNKWFYTRDREVFNCFFKEKIPDIENIVLKNITSNIKWTKG